MRSASGKAPPGGTQPQPGRTESGTRHPPGDGTRSSPGNGSTIGSSLLRIIRPVFPSEYSLAYTPRPQLRVLPAQSDMAWRTLLSRVWSIRPTPCGHRRSATSTLDSIFIHPYLRIVKCQNMTRTCHVLTLVLVAGFRSRTYNCQ